LLVITPDKEPDMTEDIGHPLPRGFFNRPTVEVAKDLLGRLLVRKLPDGQILIGRIVETEAYLGFDDGAAHAVAGRTKRTEVLFGEPGFAYIFRLRGHHCLNAVTEEIDNPACVLIRALEPLVGMEFMRQLRGHKITRAIELTNGENYVRRFK
jgi:DNA-3-methyladenine glycosylase